MAAAGGKDNVIIPPDRVLLQVQKILEIGVNEKPRDGVQWALGEMELEAEMRQLDRLVRKSSSSLFVFVCVEKFFSFIFKQLRNRVTRPAIRTKKQTEVARLNSIQLGAIGCWLWSWQNGVA